MLNAWKNSVNCYTLKIDAARLLYLMKHIKFYIKKCPTTRAQLTKMYVTFILFSAVRWPLNSLPQGSSFGICKSPSNPRRVPFCFIVLQRNVKEAILCKSKRGCRKYKKLSFASHFASQGYASHWYQDAPREKMKTQFEILCVLEAPA